MATIKNIQGGFVRRIRNAEWSSEADKAMAATILADSLSEQFPRFDRDMFLLACGVEEFEEETETEEVETEEVETEEETSPQETGKKK